MSGPGRRLAWLMAALAACLVGVPRALACSCAQDGPFLQVAKQAPLVVAVRVAEHGPSLPHGDGLHASMKVEVLDVLAGEQDAAVLVVHGDPGHMCRPYITAERFAIGADFVLVLHPATEDGGESGHAISACGEHVLALRAGDVSGRIRTERAETMAYATLRALLARPATSPGQP